MKPQALAPLVLLVALGAACGGGKPRFQHAAGWNLLSGHGELVAANVPLASADRSLASPPARTVAVLPRYGIVIWAMVFRGGNRHFPRRRLPLRVEEAVPSNPFEGFRCAPAVSISRCYAASGSVWRLFGRLSSYGVDLYVFFGTDRPLPSDIAAADAELAQLRLPHVQVGPTAAKAAACPRSTGTGYYDTSVSPASGPAGTTVTVTGRLPVASESSEHVGQYATEAVAYWNLDIDHWPSITSSSPVAAVAGSPVRLVGTENVAGLCAYQVQVTVPPGPPGTYPIDVLYGDPRGAASFAPASFQVTSG